MDITIRKTTKKELKQIKTITGETLRGCDPACLPEEAIDNCIESGTSNRELERLGLSPEMAKHWQTQIKPEESLARVTRVRKNLFCVNDGVREITTPATGRLYKATAKGALFPAVGDWVIIDQGLRIVSVLPRQNALLRGAAGNHGKESATQSQVIAANIDTVFVVCGLDRDFNLRRIERYLTLVYTCGCTPVVLLTKADLHDDISPFLADVESIAFGVPVHGISSIAKSGIDALSPYLLPGHTVALLGSSGAGKSTLVNALAGEEIQKTREVSSVVGKGVHTTTTRDLIRLQTGALLIDNPGMREIAFWETDGLGSSFPEIHRLARECRFFDCTHTSEPGCSVQWAVGRGDLSYERLESFFKQKKELDFLKNREDLGASRLEKKKGQWLAGEIKKMKKMGKMKH
ncbi:ribosome small subunit-dependent GTPase A [Desulfoluna sp.]|uniref:ribosome small subunit-dependent GTPase A n=1 Tax=Desulfoluna sp. TaxID=2045199 RepID=UPI002607F4C4|nr:ribosome small subunit-dependent GTPase A [Desulfoluna sp.]